MSKHLYTITNRQTANSVVGMNILANGTLQFVKRSPFVTGGRGSRSSQSQNGIWFDQGLIYAVDFGSESFSVFRVDAEGSLIRVNDQPIPSRGNSPCSLCVSGGVLYVLNQGIRSSGTKAEPSLTVFSVDGERVRPLPDAGFPLPRGESPTQAIVNAQGTLLAVPSVRARGSLVHIYRIDPKARSGSGLLSELAGSPFTITDTGYGFGSAWAGDGRTLFMTNAIGSGSVVRLHVEVRTGQITETARATTPGNACWTVLAKGGKRLYVSNLLSLIVFDVSDKQLKQIQSVDVTDVSKPVLRDLILRADGKFLYALEQRLRRILIYSVAKDGQVALVGQRLIGVPGHTLGLAIG